MMDKILGNLKIEKLNEMQLEAIEASKTHSDIILLSPTGSGKTLAFLLPLISKIDSDITETQALIIVPSRELAIQIEQVAKAMGTGLKINACYGGHMFSIERKSLQPPPSVLIGTPGRLADHISRGTVDVSSINTLILDEFDKSLEFGFKNEMSYIIRQLPAVRMRILTSATALDEIPDFTGINNPFEINFLEHAKKSKLQQKYIVAKDKDKVQVLYSLICMIGNRSSIVFCNHREAVDRIGQYLNERGINYGIFHGGLDQEQREEALIKLRNGTHQLLITTDLASRGLDIPEIEYIIHYQLPPTLEVFTHRNGRTARMNSEGTSYLLLDRNEHLPEYLEEQPEQETIPKDDIPPPLPEWSTLYISLGKKDKVNKVDIVGLLLQKGKLSKEDVGLIEVKDFSSYVAVKAKKIKPLMRELTEARIKNKKIKPKISD